MKRICLFILYLFFINPAYATLTPKIATVMISGSVVMPTCLVNGLNSDGLSQTIDMGYYTSQEIVTGNTKEIVIPIIINCSSSKGVNGIAFSFTPLGSYRPVGYSQPGAIRTNLNGISLSLIWKIDGTPIDLSGSVEKSLPNNNNTIDGSIKAKLSLMPGFSLDTMENGRLQSGINISIRYY